MAQLMNNAVSSSCLSRGSTRVLCRMPCDADVRYGDFLSSGRTSLVNSTICMVHRKGVPMYETNMYEGMLAESVSVQGANGDHVPAYLARPLGPGRYPGIVLIHHLSGFDDWYRWVAQEFATRGFVTIAPNLYGREGPGTLEAVAAEVCAAGGVADDQVVGDVEGALRYLRALPYSSGKVGCFGTSSGGRHTVIAAGRIDRFNAAVDCWGGRVVMSQAELTPKQPVAPIDYTKELKCPLLGLFGEEDQAPTPAQVDQHEAELKKYRKTYAFYRYPDAGHDFFNYELPSYRRTPAVDGWEKVFEFLDKYLR
jgi:carboxymethylenebutenolidase